MVAKQQALRQPAQALSRPASKTTVTMRHLRRLTLWGATAAGALLIAALASRSQVGLQRIAAVFSPHEKQVAQKSFDAQAETSRLAEAVRGLQAENGRLRARVGAVEQNVDDITGAVAKQIKEVKAQTTKVETSTPWPANTSTEPATAAVIASIVSPLEQGQSNLGAPIASPPLTSPADAPAVEPFAYGVDVGGGYSVEVLRARWLGIRSAHVQLFAGLTPTAVLRPVPRSKHVELRLVVGPLDSAEAAARLCASLAAYRLSCQPTTFDRQSVALR
ncbi:MAG: hypothetical protein ACRECE_02285 [Xanthobacteraceae bacterium]